MNLTSAEAIRYCTRYPLQAQDAFSYPIRKRGWMQAGNTVPGAVSYYPLFNSMLLMLLGISMRLLSRNNSTTPWRNDAYFAPAMLIATLAAASTYATRAIGNVLLPAAVRLFNFELMIFCVLVLVGALERFVGWDYSEGEPPVRNAVALVFLNGISVIAFIASFFLALKFKLIC